MASHVVYYMLGVTYWWAWFGDTWNKMDAESDIQVDALPYIDQEYEEPGLREAVRMTIIYCIK